MQRTPKNLNAKPANATSAAEVLRHAVERRRDNDDRLMLEKIREIASHFKPTNPSKIAKHHEIAIIPESTQSLIQWPSDEQISEVCERLRKLKEMGAQFEHKGDYFNSGELAYQIRDIIRTTADLFQRSQRLGKRL
ncbi:MAG: hypothetical protein M1608_10660 [Candidatus Omnitrophica bacterium]|nr:hypothetical protein [Candidatus Omnitrophota bacterium]